MPPARRERVRGVHMTDYEAGQIPRVPTPRPPTPRQRTLPDAPVQLADDEVYVRKYEAVRAGGRSGGNGTLYVTNARLIFYAKARGRGTQRASELLQQTRLKDITGVAAYVSYRISLGLILLTSVFTLGLLAALVTKVLIWIIIDALVVAVCILMIVGGSGRRGGAGVTIHSASTETSPINFGSFASRHGLLRFFSPFAMLFRAYTAFDVAFGAPGEDSERVIAELGALILDMQDRGMDALQRWGVTEPGNYRGESPGEPQRGIS